jgi:hypothetical protein
VLEHRHDVPERGADRQRVHRDRLDRRHERPEPPRTAGRR